MDSFDFELNIESLDKKIAPTVTPGTTPALKEACCACLKNNQHSSGVKFDIDGTFTKKAALFWDEEISFEIVKQWDPDDAAQWGAECIALLLVPSLTDLQVVERYYKNSGGGFDYWLAKKNTTPIGLTYDNNDFAGRLEVSGIHSGKKADVNSRVKRKKDQVTRSDDSGKPAYIIVVEFKAPMANASIKNHE